MLTAGEARSRQMTGEKRLTRDNLDPNLATGTVHSRRGDDFASTELSPSQCLFQLDRDLAILPSIRGEWAAYPGNVDFMDA
jgi:hypothetical protein